MFFLCVFSWGKDVIKSGLLNGTGNICFNTFSLLFCKIFFSRGSYHSASPCNLHRQPVILLPRAPYSPILIHWQFSKLHLFLLDPRCCPANCRQRWPSRLDSLSDNVTCFSLPNTPILILVVFIANNLGRFFEFVNRRWGDNQKGRASKKPTFWDPRPLAKRMHVLKLQKLDMRVERVSKRKILIY